MRLVTDRKKFGGFLCVSVVVVVVVNAAAAVFVVDAAAAVFVVVAAAAAAVVDADADDAVEAAGTVQVWKRLERLLFSAKAATRYSDGTKLYYSSSLPLPPLFFASNAVGKTQTQEKGGNNNVLFWAPYMRCDSAG